MLTLRVVIAMQGACHSQWFFYVSNWDRININVILQFTRDMYRVPNV